jgi:transposase
VRLYYPSTELGERKSFMTIARRRFTKEFKLNVVRDFTSGISAAELIRKYDIHSNLVYKWTQEFRLNPSGAFRTAVGSEQPVNDVQRIAELEQMIGRLTMENEFLKKALRHTETMLPDNKPKNGTP